MRYSGVVSCLLLASICHSLAINTNEKSYVRTAASSENTSSDKFDNEQARIVGGQNAVQGQHLYMASLWSNWRHECGGVIIAPDVLLTAAHCIQNGISNPNVLVNKAILGRWDLNDVFESTSTVIATTIQRMHPDYNVGTDQHDVGLIKLVTPITTLPTVKLNTDASLLTAGMTYTTLGWGDLGDGTFPDILQQAQVNYMSSYDCRNAPDPLNLGASYTNYIHDDMMCAFDTGKDGCFGDSGGPLLVEGVSTSSSDDIVVGITSWGIGCARMPGVYARVDYHYDWIVQNVCLLSEDPPSYFGCPETSVGATPTTGTIRDDPMTASPSISPVPSISPTIPSTTPIPTTPHPTTRMPTIISNDTPPTQAYTLGITIPPIFNMGTTSAPTSTTASPTTTTTAPTSWQRASSSQRGSNNGNAPDMDDTSSATRCSSWTLLLLLPLMLLLGISL